MIDLPAAQLLDRGLVVSSRGAKPGGLSGREEGLCGGGRGGGAAAGPGSEGGGAGGGGVAGGGGRAPPRAAARPAAGPGPRATRRAGEGYRVQRAHLRQYAP